MKEGDENPPTHAIKGDVTRVLALTDGVFAIVMTILVLELHVPIFFEDTLFNSDVSEVGYKLIFYFAAFLLAGVYWAGHRALFNLVKRVNNTLIWLNIVFLMIAALIPFGASLLGEYHYTLPLIGYGVLLLLLAAWRLLMYVYVTSHHELIFRPVHPVKRKRVIACMSIAPAFFLVSIFLAPFFHVFSLTIYIITPPIFLTLITLASKSPKQEH